MTPRLRTEIYPHAYDYCQRCFKPTLVYEFVGRPIPIRKTQCFNLFGWQVAEYQTTELGRVCLTCDTQQIEWEKTRKGQAISLLGGVGVVLFGWQYIGVASLIPAVLVLVCGSWFCRSRSKVLVSRGKNE